MNTVAEQRASDKETTLIRLGGAAGLLALALHILINYVLIELPPPSGELKTYLADGAGATIIGHGLRYPAFFSLAFFAVGLYLLTGRAKTLTGNGWGMVGLFGATAQITTGVISNTIQTVAIVNHTSLSEPPEHFMLLWNLGRVLFRVEPMFTGLMMVGFSISGWQSATLSKWIVFPGLLFAVISLLVAVFIGWTLANPSVSQYLLLARTFLVLIWFLSVSIIMLRRVSA